METRELQQIILENKIIEKEKRMGKLQNAIHKHQRRAHVCGEYGDIQKEQRHFDIIDSLIDKANRLGEEIEQLEQRDIELAEIEPPEPIHWGFARMDEGPPPANTKPLLDWEKQPTTEKDNSTLDVEPPPEEEEIPF